MLSKWYAYCLELEGGFHYVGISCHPAQRIYTHKCKEGSQLTRKYDVRSIVGAWCIGIIDKEQALTIEENITKSLKQGGPVIVQRMWDMSKMV